MYRLYIHPKCSTCIKAKSYSEKNLNNLEVIDIRTNPPSIDTMMQILDWTNSDVKKLFNTSGKLYRELGLKDKLNSMSLEEKLTLLNSNGMLIKRPLILDEDNQIAVIGFNESAYSKL